MAIKVNQFVLNIIKNIGKEQLQEDVEICNNYSGIGKGENYMGNIVKTTVQSKTSEKKLNLVVKLVPDNTELRNFIPINDAFVREAHCYNYVFPEFEKFKKHTNVFNYAKCYYANCEEYKEVIIMEDLNDKGFVMTRRNAPFDLDHMKVIITETANFHAISFAMKRINLRKYEELANILKRPLQINFFVSIMSEYWKQLVGLLTNEDSKKKFIDMLPSFPGRMAECCDFELSHPYDVICHGDSWSNNLMFKYENGKPIEMIMVDWQLSTVRSPLCDLSLILFLNTSAEVRKSHYEECMKLYYKELGRRLTDFNCNIEDCFPKNVFEEHRKKYSIYGMCRGVASCSFLYDEQGLDVTELCSEGANFRHSEKSIKHANEIVDDYVRLHLH